MGVVFENNLVALFGVLLLLAALGGLGVALWKPVGRRAWRYFVCWWQRDQIREREAQAERDARRCAEREVAADCFGANAEETATATAAATPVAAQPAQAGGARESAPMLSEPLLPTPPDAPTASLYSRN